MLTTSYTEQPATQDAETTFIASSVTEPFRIGDGAVPDEDATASPPETAPPATEMTSTPAPRRMRITSANFHSDKGGTVNLRLVEPFYAGITDLPMYTVFDSTVRFEGRDEAVALVSYINRKRLTMYVGSKLIPNGKKCRVVWEPEKLGPLPSRGEPIFVEVLSFSRRDAIGGEAVVS